MITADTLGAADDIVQGCGDLEIVWIQPGDEAEQKCDFLEKLETSRTVGLGNGAKDARMLRRARLGICVMHGEGTAVEALIKSDVLMRSIEEAINLWLLPTPSACHSALLTSGTKVVAAQAYRSRVIRSS